MTSIVFRADASLSIGSGHVMRCRTLARELRRRGAEITFVCRRQAGDLIGLLEQEFSVLALPQLSLAFTKSAEGHALTNRDLYAAWLGCKQDDDLADVLRALQQAGIKQPNWLVVDHYGLDADWEGAFLNAFSGEQKTSLLVIDDLADRPHQADCLLDQNFFGSATESRYTALVPETCCLLLGPHYALLGPEYAHFHSLVPPRSELRRLLVYFGGVDEHNFTEKALHALSSSELSHLSVDVVVGLQSPHRQLIEELVEQRPFTTLHDPLPSLAGLIARADLAIGAGGATTWERACLGLPSLVVSTDDNQWPFVQALHQAKFIHCLGHADQVSVESIRSAVSSVQQGLMSLGHGHSLSDGWGVARLVTVLLGVVPPISLRHASSLDEALLLKWANDPSVRSQSFTPDPIASDAHRRWLESGLRSPDRLHWIVFDRSGCPLGQIRFDRECCSVSERPSEVVIDLSLDRCARGKHLADELVRIGLQAMEQHWGPNFEVFALGKPSSQASQATFAKAGFVKESIVSPTSSSPVADGGPLAMPPGCITLLSDRSSWINSHLPSFIEALWHRGHGLRWIHDPKYLASGDICFLLSCGRLLSSEQLAFHSHNLVVHESDLPEGQGWSPMTWQILEGKNIILVSLFEAIPNVDQGPIYMKDYIELDGSELVDEWRSLQAETSFRLCLSWLDNYMVAKDTVISKNTVNSSYPRRSPKDSQVDPSSSLLESFNLLRTVDNKNYPAFFMLDGNRYEIYINKLN